MNKKTIRILSVISIAMILTFSISNMVFAAGIDPSTLTGTQPTDTSSITKFGNRIIGAMQVVGSVAAVIILMVLGFKYLTGSAEDKADYKKSMIPYIVGAVCIFMAPMIAGAIYKFLQ